MARLKYNGVELSYIATQALSFEPEFDESGVDFMYSKGYIRVAAVIVAADFGTYVGFHGGYPPVVPPARGGEALPDTLYRVKHLLETPRRELAYWSGSEGLDGDPDDALVFIEPDQDGVAIDAANGPFPGKVNITSVAEGRYLLTFEITFRFVDCPNQTQSSGPDLRKAWVSHRWSESQQLDDAGTTTELVRTGRIIARSDMVANADVLRELVTPLPPKGFMPVRARYALRDDGLRLDYELAWRERGMMPPGPAYEADGEYAETYPNAAERWGECWCSLKGQEDVDRIKLLTLALSVCLTKMQGQQFADAKDVFLGAMSIKSALWGPNVECRMRFKLRFDGNRVGNNEGLKAAISLRQFSPRLTPTGPEKPNAQRQDLTGKTLPGTPLSAESGKQSESNPYPVRGTADIRLIAAALHDPCGQQLDSQAPAENIINLQAAVALPPNKHPTADERYNDDTTNGSLQPDTLPTQSSGQAQVQVLVYPASTDITITDDSKLKDDDPGVYELWQAKKVYWQDAHEVVYPLCKQSDDTMTVDPQPVVVELAPPTHYCGLSFRAVKTGFPPRIPDPKADFPESWRLLKSVSFVEFQDPVVMADGESMRYSVVGRYVWLIKDPTKTFMAPPLPPYHRFKPDDYKDTLKTSGETINPENLKNCPTMEDLFTTTGDPESSDLDDEDGNNEVGPNGNLGQL